jgi:hypothetical protein
MEINTSYPTPNPLLGQVSGRDKKLGGIEEFAESSKLTSQNGDAEKTQQARSGDTVSLSSESLKLAQTASLQSDNSDARIENREQAQQVVGQLISGISANQGQANAVYRNVSRTGVASLLN